jgi:acyl transferase domain-containing protein/acyl carrier protein
MSEKVKNQSTGLEIAIIGMAGRFPGAKNIDEFWKNLENGVESISFFSDKELEESGIDPGLIKSPGYVKAKGVIEELDYFDASFFEYTPREAETLDPQTRIFHECTWEALENAGYDPYSYQGLIGLYAGAAPNPYWEAVCSVVKTAKTSEQFASLQLYDRDFLASRVSYKLGLKGTTFSVFTACSTSLVAVHAACIGILGGECDMALAGGVSVVMPQKIGYLYEEGMIFSPDGHNRTLDENAAGSVFGDGVGVVMLKRLEDAVNERDNIHALIKGSAINNDGNRKLGYTAPSVEGQDEVIRSALEMAEVEPESITYLEAHGTATPLGDMVEIEALNRVYAPMKKMSCPIGSVKSNVGHLNIAAGISGLIKTVLALKHKNIPPSLHYKTPNPRIDFKSSPFYVNTRLLQWKNHKYPLRAGVSSFGIGGTNIHLILEEWPGDSRQTVEDRKQKTGDRVQSQARGGISPPCHSRQYQLIMLSAKTYSSLDNMTKNLAEHFKKNLLNRDNRENPLNPGLTLADAAYTLKVGRPLFPYRRMAVCSNVNEAVDILSPENQDDPSPLASRKVHTFFTEEKKRTVIFIFAGLGDQYVNMGRELYEKEPIFQGEMNRCFEILEHLMDQDIKEILYPGIWLNKENPPVSPGLNGFNKTNKSYIHQMEIAQVTVFIIEYSLAHLLMEWGIRPRAMMGYSFGEYAAACIAGVIALEDALKMVVARGRLMNQTPPGAMLSVPLSIEPLTSLIKTNDQLSIAIDNGASCIIAGPPEAVEAFEKQMKGKRLICIRLETAHAVHSSMMVPILDSFQEAVNEIPLNPPKIPYISNVTGDWLTEKEALSHEYWVQHLRHTVQYSEGLSRLLKNEDALFLEIGPGRALSTHLNQQENGKENRHLVLNLLKHPEESIPDVRYLLNKIGHLWLWGVSMDWQAFYRQEKRYRSRIPLPTYPFERQRYWKDLPSGFDTYPSHNRKTATTALSAPGKQPDVSQWFYYPSWKPSWLPEMDQTPEQKEEYILIFMDECGLGSELAALLEAEGHHVILVKKAAAFAAQPGEKTDSTGSIYYYIDPGQPDHFRMLLNDMSKRYRLPDRVLYLWGVTNSRTGFPGIETIDLSLERYFYHLIFLARAIGSLHRFENIHLLVLTDNMQDVTGEEVLSPEKAPAASVCKVISQEYSNITCRSIDIVLPEPGSWQRKKLGRQLLKEITALSSDLVVVYRGNYRWVQTYEPVHLSASITGKSLLKPGGVYLITGGLGGIGHMLAKHLASSLKAKLILTGLTTLPARNRWDNWLSTHPGEDGVSRRIRKVQELEALGVEVMLSSADVANEGQMRQVISAAERHFGNINGIIHTAGVVGRDSVCIVAEIDKQRAQLNFRPKIHGMLVLEKVLRKKNLDFCLLMSSISSVLGGLGLAAYSAANLFMDTFTRKLNLESPISWICVNWDGWRTPTHEANQPAGFSAAAWEDFAMTPEQGIESFQRILSLESPGHVVHSTGPLQARINQWLNLESLRQKQSSPVKKGHSSLYSRPGLLQPYTAPRNQMEEIIADVWQTFLGINQVGINDNFFDLKATSLDIVRVNSILRNKLKKDIPAVTMFKYPTIGTLARFLSQEGIIGEPSREETDREEILLQGQSRVKNIRNRVKRNY